MAGTAQSETSAVSRKRETVALSLKIVLLLRIAIAVLRLFEFFSTHHASSSYV
jgi:hypothetical protein